ncbi:DUF6979 family protein [Microbulbifer sp. VAAC004]|uniref:DUF6979 family protein n=1 Tax=unclassified Microbulbifer TaxID=2619833 RepID=UPI00403A460C
MNNYSTIAVKAAELLMKGEESSPLQAWHNSAQVVFPDSVSAQEKGCPKSAFLGVCEEGYVCGVPKGKYTSSTLNKRYALRGLELLRDDPSLTEMELWKHVSNKKYNQQMHVVKSLFDAGLVS